MAEQKKSTNSSVRFFSIVGFIGMAFGACVALFNLAYSPVESAILSVLFLSVGGVCSMYALGLFLSHLDKTLFTTKSRSTHH